MGTTYSEEDIEALNEIERKLKLDVTESKEVFYGLDGITEKSNPFANKYFSFEYGFRYNHERKVAKEAQKCLVLLELFANLKRQRVPCEEIIKQLKEEDDSYDEIFHRMIKENSMKKDFCFPF
jgi:hypothetical protein